MSNVAPEILAEALVLVDVQRGFLERAAALPGADALIGGLDSLLARARAEGALVIHLQNDGAAGQPDEPDSAGWHLAFPPRPGAAEVVLRKTTDDGFEGTPLGRVLAEHEVTRIVIGGLLSEMCVSATARTALRCGLQVVLPQDAHATYDLDDIPARQVARVAEHALGDQLSCPASSSAVRFLPTGRGGSS